MIEKPRLVAAGVFYCSTRPLSRNCEYPYLVYLIGLAAIGSSSGPAVPRQKWVGHVKEKTMNIEKYSERVRGFIQSAQSYALAEGHQQFMPEHLLKVLMDDDQGMASSLIERAGGRPADVRLANDAAIAKLPKVTGGNGQLYLSQPVAKVFQSAEKAAKKPVTALSRSSGCCWRLSIEASAETSQILKNAGVTAQMR
jgi:hypothetical protein